MNKKSNVIVGLSVVAVVGLAVFGLSVFGKTGEGSEPVRVVTEQRAVAPTLVQEVKEVKPVSEAKSEGGYVASKQGKKYFPVDCGTAKSIKEENKVFFGSESEAVAAGYERSLTCK